MTSARYLVLFQQRCAACHGVDGAAPRAASLEALRALSPERVYEALTAGSMAVNAGELSDEEKRGLATYVAGRPFGSAVDRSAAAMSNPCPSNLTPDGRLAAAQWNGKNADPTTGARFQSAGDAGLTADDVSRLALRWSFGLPGSGGMRAQPVVVGGRLYLGSDNGVVYALDARSGCVHWSFDVGTPVVSAVSVGTIPGTEMSSQASCMRVGITQTTGSASSIALLASASRISRSRSTIGTRSASRCTNSRSQGYRSRLLSMRSVRPLGGFGRRRSSENAG